MYVCVCTCIGKRQVSNPHRYGKKCDQKVFLSTALWESDIYLAYNLVW